MRWMCIGAKCAPVRTSWTPTELILAGKAIIPPLITNGATCMSILNTAGTAGHETS